VKLGLAGIFFVFAAIVVAGLMGACSVGPNAVSGIMPVQQQSGGVQGSGAFTLSTSGSVYLSSGGTAATSTPCNWVTLSVSTSAASLSTSSTASLALPVGQVLTLSTSNLNALQVSGSGAKIGYLYGQ
jgi:hypothetical protein